MLFDRSLAIIVVRGGPSLMNRRYKSSAHLSRSDRFTFGMDDQSGTTEGRLGRRQESEEAASSSRADVPVPSGSIDGMATLCG